MICIRRVQWLWGRGEGVEAQPSGHAPTMTNHIIHLQNQFSCKMFSSLNKKNRELFFEDSNSQTLTDLKVKPSLWPCRHPNISQHPNSWRCTSIPCPVEKGSAVQTISSRQNEQTDEDKTNHGHLGRIWTLTQSLWHDLALPEKTSSSIESLSTTGSIMNS